MLLIVYGYYYYSQINLGKEVKPLFDLESFKIIWLHIFESAVEVSSMPASQVNARFCKKMLIVVRAH